MKTPEPPKSAREQVIPLRRGAVAPDQAKNMSFTLREVRVSGSEKLPASKLSSIWSSRIGQTISVADVYSFVDAIVTAYVIEGYALSFALLPEQKIENGIVQIVVVEGFVDDVDVTGGPLPSGLQTQVLASIERIKASKPLRTADLERALLLINDIPGVTARAVFSASKSKRNASSMTIAVTRDVVEGSVAINNRLAKNLGRWRAGGVVDFNGSISGTDQVSLSAFHALNGEGFVYGNVTLQERIGTDGLTVSASGTFSRDVPLEGLLATVDYKGEMVDVTLGASYPVIRSRPENWTVGASASYINSKSEASGSPLTEDQVRFLEAWTTYDVADTIGGVNFLRASLRQGLDVADATDDASILKSRANGSVVFSSLTLFASRTQTLLQGFSVHGQVLGQAALADPLLSVSECGLGGQTFGRAYDAGALSGDHCAFGLAELRFDQGFGGWGVQVYGYADAGWVQQKGELEPGERRSNQTTSAGAGVRVGIGTAINLTAELAVPLRDRFSEGGDGDPRALFSANVNY